MDFPNIHAARGDSVSYRNLKTNLMGFEPARPRARVIWYNGPSDLEHRFGTLLRGWLKEHIGQDVKASFSTYFKVYGGWSLSVVGTVGISFANRVRSTEKPVDFSNSSVFGVSDQDHVLVHEVSFNDCGLDPGLGLYDDATPAAWDAIAEAFLPCITMRLKLEGLI